MSGPFSNSDSGEMFIANRCARCIHRGSLDGADDPCDEFIPAYLGEWPVILVSADTPVGVECTRFQVGEPGPAAVSQPEAPGPDDSPLVVDPRLADCWMPQQRRWRAVRARDVLLSVGQLGQVEWISHGGEWRSAGRPQAKVVGHPAFPVDLDAEVTVLVPTLERDALGVLGEQCPAGYGIEDCARHEHVNDEVSA